LKFLQSAPRKNILKVRDFDIVVVFGFYTYENGNAYAYIDDVDKILKNFDIHLSESLLRMMLSLAEVLE